MQMEASKDKASAEFQRLSWDALRKSINGLINKVSPLFCDPRFRGGRVDGRTRKVVKEGKEKGRKDES